MDRHALVTEKPQARSMQDQENILPRRRDVEGQELRSTARAALGDAGEQAERPADRDDIRAAGQEVTPVVGGLARR